MRPGTKIPPLFSNVVNCDRFFLNALQNLQLIRLIECFNPLLSLFPGHLLPYQWEVPSDDPIHLLFNLLEVLIR
uniref:EMB2761 (EMBRYO DEFECTIVE 2761) n=1 Tax=Arundo donax TaxID=35708 RepID=A0A0A9F381_ARUDO